MGGFLEEQTRKLEVDNRLPIKYYYRSADNVLRQASIYRAEDNVLELYVLLLRFSSLIMETIPAHREYYASFPHERADFLKRLREVVTELERLQPKAKQIISAIERGARPASLAPPRQSAFAAPSGASYACSGDAMDFLTGSPDWSALARILGEIPEHLEDLEHGSSALKDVRLLQVTVHSLAAGRDSFAALLPPTSKPKGPSRAFTGLTKTKTKSLLLQVQYPSYIDSTPIEMPSLQPLRPVASTRTTSSDPEANREPVLWPEAEAPVAAEPASQLAEEGQDIAPLVNVVRQPSDLPMAVPVQNLDRHNNGHVRFAEGPPESIPPSAVADPRPGVPLLVDGDSAESKGPKPVHIAEQGDTKFMPTLLGMAQSAKMMEEFMLMVKSNTAKNLETCGVLAGLLKKGTFYVTTLILPKQEATSDSCQTVNEEEIFDVQDKRGLFQLGWIHVRYHPEVMLPEAVAIVMAPSDASRRYGIFRLSEPGGVKVIQSCQRRGFHPHEMPADGGAIYEHCSHVFLNSSLKFELMDLRQQ
eukprot:SM000198S05333  [mRNA]  locus=s198:145076:149400:- [translate_table: standard]